MNNRTQPQESLEFYKSEFLKLLAYLEKVSSYKIAKGLREDRLTTNVAAIIIRHLIIREGVMACLRSIEHADKNNIPMSIALIDETVKYTKVCLVNLPSYLKVLESDEITISETLKRTLSFHTVSGDEKDALLDRQDGLLNLWNKIFLKLEKKANELKQKCSFVEDWETIKVKINKYQKVANSI